VHKICLVDYVHKVCSVDYVHKVCLVDHVHKVCLVDCAQSMFSRLCAQSMFSRLCAQNLFSRLCAQSMFSRLCAQNLPNTPVISSSRHYSPSWISINFMYSISKNTCKKFCTISLRSSGIYAMLVSSYGRFDTAYPSYLPRAKKVWHLKMGHKTWEFRNPQNLLRCYFTVKLISILTPVILFNIFCESK
jgi:hypothetical protein